MNIPQLTWFKSSYSGSSGDACVEVALTWYKSSYSGDSGDDCVEAAPTPSTVHIRDSKNKNGAILAIPPATWTAFVPYAAGHGDRGQAHRAGGGARPHPGSR